MGLDLDAFKGAEEEDYDRVRLKRSLREYAPEAWRQCQPTVPFDHNWHHDAIAEHLTAVTEGQIRFLWISIAPRHTKSWYVCVFWPTWHWIQKAWTQWISASYSKDYSVRDSVASRRLIDTPWYQARWGCKCGQFPHAEWCTGFIWTTDQNVKEFYENDRGGRRLTAGVEAGTTGQGGDILVLDDPIDIHKADSEAVRQSAKKYVGQTFLGRMNDPSTTAVVGIAQRTHVDDPTAYVLGETGLPWTHLCLPSEYDPRRSTVTVLGWKDPRTEEGEPLWKGRYTKEVLESEKIIKGPYGYHAQHQQNPSPLSGGIIRRDWWRFWIPAGLDPEAAAHLREPIRSKEGVLYPPAIPLPPLHEVLLSWDCSFKDEAGQVRKGKAPDPVSGGAWGRSGPSCFLLDRVNRRMDIVETCQEVRDMMRRFPQAEKKIIEDKANGPAVMAILRRECGGFIPATPTLSKRARVMTAITTEKDSDARAMSMVALLAAHNVYAPHPAIAPWVWDYIEEHAAFPNGKNDDDVDMTSQALMHLEPWVWREADSAQSEAYAHGSLKPAESVAELHRRRLLAASGLRPEPGQIRDPYRRGR